MQDIAIADENLWSNGKYCYEILNLSISIQLGMLNFHTTDTWLLGPKYNRNYSDEILLGQESKSVHLNSWTCFEKVQSWYFWHSKLNNFILVRVAKILPSYDKSTSGLKMFIYISIQYEHWIVLNVKQN